MIYKTAASATGSGAGDTEREREGSSHCNGNGINESHMQRLSDDFAALMTCQPAGGGSYMQRLRRV